MRFSPMSFLASFLKTEAAGGVVLMIATIAAILVANSSWQESYHGLLEARLGPLSTLSWVNDGLMALFFFVVGMEIKSEMTTGLLASRQRAILPMAGALGGMIVPAAVYLMFRQDRGWGIPMATDIAFAVGVLSLFGRRIPTELKVFLLALAIVDDLGAVVVIALFYTAKISVLYLGLAAAALVAIVALRSFEWSRRSMSRLIFIPLGLLVWFAVHESGVHATVAGCVLGGLMRDPKPWIARLHGWSSFLILPLFAFVNAGLSVGQVAPAEWLTSSVINGISFGLFLGKPVGILTASWLVVKMGWARTGLRWPHLVGAGCLGGIGFTMSLFISGLALSDAHQIELAKLGIMKGSLISALLGSVVLILVGRFDGKSRQRSSS